MTNCGPPAKSEVDVLSLLKPKSGTGKHRLLTETGLHLWGRFDGNTKQLKVQPWMPKLAKPKPDSKCRGEKAISDSMYHAVGCVVLRLL